MRMLALMAVLVTAKALDDKMTMTTFHCAPGMLQYYWSSAVDGVASCGAYAETEGTLYTTNNGGKIWTKEANTVDKCPNGVQGGNCIRAMIPEDSKHGLLITSSGVIEWTHSSVKDTMMESTEVGAASLNFENHQIKVHPTQKNRILAMESIFKTKGLSENTCPDYLIDAVTSCPHKVHYSDDYGKTFRPLFDDDTEVYQLDWGNDSDGQSFSDDFIYYIGKVTAKVDGSPDVKYSLWSQVMRYDMKTKEKKLILQDAEYFLKFGVFTYYLVRGRVGLDLYVSSTNGMRVTKTELPSKDKIERHTIIDYSSGNGVDQSVFLAAYHTPCAKLSFVVPYCTMYRSDKNGEYFEVSLKGLRMNIATSKPDIHAAAGISGIYLANIASQEGADDCNKCNSFMDCRTACKFATHMSWANGKLGTWKQIRLDSRDKSCADNCFLHLHDSASDQIYIPQLMSKKTTPGLMMGCGNVGEFLDIEGRSVNTYISRDSGETWFTIIEGAHLYNWLDYGGMLIMVKSGEETKSFSVSWDMGETWQEHVFTDTAGFYATDIVLPGGRQSDHQSASFIIVGISYAMASSDPSVTLSFHIDMNSEKKNLRTCTAIDEKHASPDYTRFNPAKNGSCFLGWDVTYFQKARGAKCWNTATAEEMEAVHDKIKCECAIDVDYECESGFRRTHRNLCESADVSGPVWDIDKKVFIHEQDPHVPPECKGTYLRTKGYILTSHCDPGKQGSIDLTPVIANCPANSPSTGNTHANDHTGGQHTAQHCTPITTDNNGHTITNGGDTGGSSSSSSSSGHGFLIFLLVLLIVIGVALLLINIFAKRGNPTAMGIKLILEEYSSKASNKVESLYSGVRRSYGPVVHTGPALSDDDLDDHPDIIYPASAGTAMEVRVDAVSPPIDPPVQNEVEEEFATFGQPPVQEQSETAVKDDNFADFNTAPENNTNTEQ